MRALLIVLSGVGFTSLMRKARIAMLVRYAMVRPTSTLMFSGILVNPSKMKRSKSIPDICFTIDTVMCTFGH